MPAHLHHERTQQFDHKPVHWLLLTHGIFGSATNWRGIARKLTERRPEWGVVLVDLRQHGRSEPGPPPHTITACAEDLRALITELGDIDAMAGHSFGGKVVLATRPLVRVRQTWVLDSSPSARPVAPAGSSNVVLGVLEMLERLPRTWAKRDDFVAAVVAEGHAPAFAQWLAMNVIPEPTGAFKLRLDTEAMREMLADHRVRDLWDSVFDPAHGDVELVIANRSTSLSPDDRARLEHAPPHVHVHHLDAGHWLHIDAPAAVVELFAARLPT